MTSAEACVSVAQLRRRLLLGDTELSSLSSMVAIDGLDGRLLSAVAESELAGVPTAGVDNDSVICTGVVFTRGPAVPSRRPRESSSSSNGAAMHCLAGELLIVRA